MTPENNYLEINRKAWNRRVDRTKTSSVYPSGIFLWTYVDNHHDFIQDFSRQKFQLKKSFKRQITNLFDKFIVFMIIQEELS